MSASKVLDKLEKEVRKKGFDPIMDYGSEDEISRVYYALGSPGNEKEELIDYWADQLNYNDDEHNEEDYYRELAEKDYAKWDKENDFPTEGPVWDEALKNYIDELYSDFESEFYDNTTFVGTRIELYRCIQVEDPTKFLDALKKGVKFKIGKKSYEGAGVFWSWDKDAAECHWGGDGETYIDGAGYGDCIGAAVEGCEHKRILCRSQRKGPYVEGIGGDFNPQ